MSRTAIYWIENQCPQTRLNRNQQPCAEFSPVTKWCKAAFALVSARNQF
jgi:hypothetical protein